MSPETASQVGAMMGQVVKEGTGTAAALRGHRRRGQDRHRRGRPPVRAQPAVVHRLRARAGPARRHRRYRGMRDRVRRHRRRPDRQGRDAGAPEVTERLEAETVVDGRYRVLHRLGSGGMAEVYCAQDLQLGRKVALKILYRRFAEDGEFVERFRREASSAAGLQHQHVVAVYDRGEYDGTYYIAMEYLEGRSLKTIVQQEAPLDPDRAIDLTIQVLRAARFAHRRGIIHRDLKPHNVIVDADGPRQGHRLRHRPRRRVGHDPDRLDHGHGAVPVARAGPGPRGQRGVGHLLDRDHALRAAHRPRPVRGRERRDDRAQAGQRAPRAAQRLQPRGHARARGGRSCARWRRTRRAATPTPTRFIAALQAARDGTATAVLAPVPPPPLEPPERGLRLPRGAAGAARAARGRALVAVAAGGAGGRPRPRRRAAAPRHAEGRACPRWSAPTRPTPRPSCARTASASTPTLKTAEQPKGQVIGQDPTGGTKAKKGSTVTLTVSDGPQQVAVPQVVGLTVSSARGRLEKAGLEPSEREENSDTVEKGQGDLGQPAGGPEGRQGLVGHARRLQRQAAGRGPRRRRQELRRGPVDPAGGRASRSRARTRSPTTRTRAPCSRRTPRAARRSTRARRSRSRWPRRPARSPCPT